LAQSGHAQEHTYEINFGGDLQGIFYFSLLGLTISLVLLHLFGTDIGTILFYAD